MCANRQEKYVYNLNEIPLLCIPGVLCQHQVVHHMIKAAAAAVATYTYHVDVLFNTLLCIGKIRSSKREKLRIRLSRFSSEIY